MYKGPAKNISEIAAAYKVGVKLIRKWITESEKINIGNRRILKPKEIAILYAEWGMPEEE